ncbi:MAG TPA: right-handed parallel beta-helix repeat-containing protein [Solirubrobacterales bacterium]|nr:right-handed parallel beta-helix repeat-containing protein [Solirubrobacterales bacterium]
MSLSILGAAPEAGLADFVRVSPAGVDAGNDCHFHPPEWTPCATIQHAVDEADGFDWVDIDAGVYEEEVVVDKPGLTLIGPGGPGRLGEPQALIDGGSGTAVSLEAKGISLRQLSIVAGATGTPVRAAGVNIDDLRVQENIISGGSSGVLLEANGANVSIGFNLIDGAGDGIRLRASSLSELSIRANHFTASIDGYAVLADGSATIEGLSLDGNDMAVPTRITGLVEESFGEENDITENQFEATSGPQLAINGLEARIMGNSFDGHGSSGCLQILGNQGGLTPSSNILVSLGNAFVDCDPYGIELGPAVDGVSIFGNRFPGTYDGVVASGASPWNVTGRVRIEGNRIVGTTHLGVVNQASGTLGARENWWGCNPGPGASGCDTVSAGVDTSDNVRLVGLIGPRTEEDGIIELPTGHSIALNPGEEAEVAAVLTSDGSEPILGIPTEGVPVGFSSSVGTLSSATSSLQNGYTFDYFTAGSTPGEGSIVVSMDNQHTLVPVTIRGATTGTPPTKPIKTPPAPTLVVTGKHKRLAGHQVTIGLVSCADSCQVAPGRARIVIGHHAYRGTSTPRGTLAAGSTTPIRVTLSPPALRALREFGRARILVTVTVSDAAGRTATRAISTGVHARLGRRPRPAGDGRTVAMTRAHLAEGFALLP